MLQSMRSGVIVHPGETNGCIGCHEDRLSAPLNINSMPLAIGKKPQKLSPENKEPPVFSFIRDVQPVFDKHCVQCHDFGKPAGEVLILAGDRNPYFNASYIDLHFKKQINCVGGGPAEIQQAYSWGSHASKLVEIMEKGHHADQITGEEMETIYTWIDLNGVYYPEYESAYPDNPAGRSPLTFDQLDRLGELTGVDFNKLANYTRTLGPQISFERPELSPCLDSIRVHEAVFSEALEIIKTGQKQLSEVPRADMAGFVPSGEHRMQLEKYMQRLKVEKENNRAASEGRTLFDAPMQSY